METSQQLREYVWNRQKAMCGKCGKKHDGTFENEDINYISLSENLITNDDLVMLCKQCNQSILSSSKNSIVIPEKKYNFQFANFENYLTDNVVNDFKNDIELLESLVTNSNDFRASETKIKEFKIKNFNFIKDKSIQDELTNKLDTLLKDVKNKFNEENKKIEEAYQANYQLAKEKIAPAENIVKNAVNYKNAREELIAIQNEIKNINLKREHKDEFILTFNKYFEELNQKQQAERESYEMECIDNYHSIKSKIDNVLMKVQNTNIFKEARELLIEIQSEFKGLKLKKEQRDEQYARIQAAFEDLNKRQSEERELFNKESKENYDIIKSEVDAAIEFSKTSPIYKQAREVLINLQNKIKDTKLTKESRDEFYSAIRTAFENINKRQEEEKSTYEAECLNNYNMLKANVVGAVEFAATAINFKEAREHLINVQSTIKGLTLTKEQREELYQLIRDSFDSLNLRQNTERELFEKESSENYQVLKNKIVKITDEMSDAIPFRQIRETLIAVQNEVKILKLKKEQREELFNDIRAGFEKYDNIRNQYSEQMKQDKVEKLRNILFNLEAKIPRIEELLARDKDSLEYQQFKLNEVRPGEKEEEIKNEIQEKIDAIQSRINERLASIDETKQRIEQIKKEIEEL